MSFLGFINETIKWYTSHLPNRKFIISIKNAYLGKASMTCGVLQGSVLGPLFLFIYIKNIPQTVDNELLLYDDDTCLFFQHHRNIKSNGEASNSRFFNFG